MNSLAADQYGPVPCGKYCIVSVNEPTCFFKGSYADLCCIIMCAYMWMWAHCQAHKHTHMLTYKVDKHISLPRFNGAVIMGREVSWPE